MISNIFSDFSKAVGQLPDPRFRRVLGLGILLTIALLFALYAVLLGLVQWMTGEATTLPFISGSFGLGDLLSLGSIVFVLILSVILMIPVASAITSLFLDDICDAVESKHYPSLPPLPRRSFYDGLRETINFFGLLVLANLIALIMAAVLPFIAPAIFYGVNGFMLSREYFQMVALRRMPRAEAIALRKANRGEIWLAGIFMALPLTIPIVNLIIPVLGAATFTHQFNRLSQQSQVKNSGRTN